VTLRPLEIEVIEDEILADLSEDASRGTMDHRIRKADGSTTTAVRLDAAWLSLKTRELVGPPDELADVLRAAPRA
jgi:acyl-CoA thioesterase FadM